MSFPSDHLVVRSRRPPSAPATSSWAGRVTIPEPFALTSSTTMDNIHRRKCVHQAEAEKLQKEVEEELTVHRSFKGEFLAVLELIGTLFI